MKYLTQILVRSILALWFTSISAWAVVAIDPPTRTFTKDGGGGSILTSGTGTWVATKNADWLTITPRTTGNAGESCIYVVNSNLTADTRQGIITVEGNIHTVTQTGYAATLSPTSATANLNGITGSISITTQAGVSWTAVSNSAWITVTPGSGTSNGSVAYTVAPYAGVVSRTGSLTIAGKTFTVTQTGADVNLAPKTVEKAYSSDIVQVQVTALGTTVWSVIPQSSWISVIDGGNGFGDSNVTLAVSTNPSFAARTGTVSIGTASFTIHQAGTPNPVLDLLPREATADPTGAYGNVAVVATPDAPWTAQSMDPWLILSSGSSGAGNGNIQYVASANPSLTPRTGRVRVNPPVYVPAVDLTKQLWTYIPRDGVSDSSGWQRNLSGYIGSFNGTSSKTLTGPDFSRENDHSMTLAVQFKVDSIDTINRLLQIQRSATDYTAVYVNAQNKLVLHIGTQIFTTNFTVQAGTWHQLVLAATHDHQVRFYAGSVGSEQIGLIGSYSPGIAPFPYDYLTTTNRITFGYSSLPNTGYLNNGAMKELRIYGRALSVDEVNSLHLSSLNGLPFGSEQSVVSPAPAVRMNLRGQALLKIGEGAVSDGHEYQSGSISLSLNTAANLGGSEKEVQTSVASGAVLLVTGSVSLNRSSATNEGSIEWRYRFNYEDGTNAITPLRNAVSWGGSTSASATYTDRNPYPLKSLSSVTLLARMAGSYISSYSGSFYSKQQERKLSSTWKRSSDRYGLAQRALLNQGSDSITLTEHQGYFSNSSATYNFWLRMDSMPAPGSLWRILTRRSSSNLAELSINANGHLSLEGIASTSFASLINVGEWHMVTLAGSYSPGTATVFVDGEEVGNVPTSNYSYGADNKSTVMTLGAYSLSSYDFHPGFIGAIGEVSFYDGVLTSNDIRTIYQREAPQSIYHTVTQGVVDPAVSPQLVQMPSAGGGSSVQLTVAQNVNWTVSTAAPWITVTSPAQGAGSTTVSYDVAANPTVYQRQGEILVAGKTVTVVQAGLNATVQHEPLVFSTDGGSGWIEVSPEGNGQWQAVSDVSWLTVALGASGAGQGSVFIVADPYTNTSSSRTGTITVAGQKVYVTQRGYELSISPQVAQIGSNAGAGEFGVAAPLSAVWEAIATQPWITIMGGTNGIGNGTIRYSVAANDTGAVRTGRIIVSGREYTITQVTSLLLTTQTSGGGTVAGAGSYNTNATAVLTATPTGGNVFSHWSGDAVGSANPLNLIMDFGKTVTAHFIPATAADTIASAAVQGVIANPNPHGLYTSNQMHGLALGRPVLDRDPVTGKMTLRLGLKRSTNLTDWSDLTVLPGDVGVVGGKLDMTITPQGNAAFYRLDGN